MQITKAPAKTTKAVMHFVVFNALNLMVFLVFGGAG